MDGNYIIPASISSLYYFVRGEAAKLHCKIQETASGEILPLTAAGVRPVGIFMESYANVLKEIGKNAAIGSVKLLHGSMV